MKPRRPLLGALAVWLVASGVALPAETVGQVMTLPERPGPHWFWLSDILLHRTALFDADTGGLLGQISSGTAGVGFVIAPHVETPGCSLVYAAGTRRFLMLCANGAALSVLLDDEGGTARLERSEPFFDPQKDPVTEKAVRRGSERLVVSVEGVMHPVDVSCEKPRFGETWSLVDDADRRASWRIGGGQHLAVHAASGRLYALMHQGGPDTHKAPGSE